MAKTSAARAEIETLPTITCPACGNHMRLSTIMPEDNHRECMTFVCDCGFDYRQSQAVTAERVL